MASYRYSPLQTRRRGGAAILIMSMIAVLVIAAAFTVDYSYMQLVRTELRTVSDAAAKAGAEALSRTQNVDIAKREAIRYAALNTVGNQPFRLSENDVVIGNAKPAADGSWEFKAGATPSNAVRINARTGTGAAQPAVPLFFSRIVGHLGFSPNHQATAGQQEVEICLCLDRSGSMNFDMTGVDFSFPTGNPRLSRFRSWGPIWRNMLSPPHPTKSRWGALRGAVDVFLDEVSTHTVPPRTGLVTWASDMTMPVRPFTKYYASTIDHALPATTDFKWVDNRNAIKKVVNDKSNGVLMGGTNLSAGLTRAIDAVSGSNSNSNASKVVILLTDGEWNEGNNPTAAAYRAKERNITVHSISMLTKQQAILQDIAEITGGRYYRTINEKELREAFKAIANSLPVVLIE